LAAFKIPLDKSPLSLSLYIHLPFCLAKCAYCDFFSVPLTDWAIASKVVQEIIVQIRTFFSHLNICNVKTIYIGGGTPSVLSIDLLSSLFKEINYLCIKPPQEWTIEANPLTITKDFIRLCRDWNITRISVGIQSLKDDLLAVLEREGSKVANLKALSLLNELWQGDVNIDLIAGIPGQTNKDIREDISQVLKYKPCHVSFYSLTIEKNTRLFDYRQTGRLKLPGPELIDELWIKGAELLTEAGYEHYEVSNFALYHKRSLHNLQYWLLNPYLGVGAAAVSTLPGKQGKVLRISAPHNIASYLAGKKQLWGLCTEIIAPPAFILENLIMGLRLKSGIPKRLFYRRFQKELPGLIPELWHSWKNRKLISNTDTAYAFTLKARLILNVLLRELMDYQDAFKGITVNWP